MIVYVRQVCRTCSFFVPHRVVPVIIAPGFVEDRCKCTACGSERSIVLGHGRV